jgi:hypothetical protein
LVQAEVAFNLGLIDTRQRRQAEVIQDQVVELVRNNNWRAARNMSDALLKYITQASGEDQRLPPSTNCLMNVKILRLTEQLIVPYCCPARLGAEWLAGVCGPGDAPVLFKYARCPISYVRIDEVG